MSLQQQFAHIRLGDDTTQLYRPEGRFTTAHASAEGYVMLTCIITGAGSKCELAAVSRYKGRPTLLHGEQVTACLEDNEEDDDYESFRDAAKSMGSYRAFGTESNFGELAAERINYSIRADELDWSMEVIDLGGGRKFKAPADLRGFKEMDNPGGVRGELLEPITSEETLSFVESILGPQEVDVETAQQSRDIWLQPTLARCIERTEAALELCSLEDLCTYLGIPEQQYRRLRASAERKNIDGSWCHSNIYNIGEREGVTTEQARQNDIMYSKLEQHHQLYERVDGKLLFSQELQQAEKTNLIYQLFDHNKKGPDGGPQVRSWADQSLYMRRCAMERDKRFAAKLWHVLTWPLDILADRMPALRAKYKASVRANAPGPHRARINGKWQDAPMTGDEAINHIRRNPGTLKGKRMKRTVRVFTGHTWHKLFLTKGHMTALEEAYRWRQGFVTISIGDKLVEEKFENTYQGLPASYVKRAYGSKRQ